MDLLLLQNEEELALAQRKLGDTLNDLRIMAWTPFAVEALRKQNIDYETAAGYSDGNFKPAVMISQFQEYKEWCDLVDKHIAQLVPEVASLGIRPFLNKLLALRMPFFLYFHELDKLDLVLKRLRPNSVYFFHYATPQLSLLSRLVDVIGENLGVNFISFTPSTSFRSMFPAEGLTPDWFDRTGRGVKLAKFILRRPTDKSLAAFLSGISGYPLFPKKSNNILILDPDISARECLRQLQKEISVNFIFWEDVYVKQNFFLKLPVQEIIKRLKNDLGVHRWTTHREIDLFDLFIPEIEKTLKNDLPLMVSTVKQFRRLHEIFSFKLVVTTYVLTGGEAIFDQAEDLDIPLVLVLHGSSSGLIDGYPELPICFHGRRKFAPVYNLVYSEKVANYIDNSKKYFPYFTACNVALGSRYFEKLIEKNGNIDWQVNHPLKICYICGAVGISNPTFKGGLYDDASLYDLRYRIIKKFKDKSHLTLYYKMGYNTEDYGLELEQEILKGSRENIEAISSEKSLCDILEKPDIFILEIPSTTLFEVLTTTKPIVLLVDPRALALTEEAQRLLKNRVTIVRSRQELEECLDDIIANGVRAQAFTKPNHHDKTFITTYATCGDYKGTQRIVDFLKFLLTNNQKNDRP